MEDLGDRIKKRRKELKLSQESLAFSLGYTSKGTVAQWEIGLTIPKNIHKLAEVLKTNPEWLETGRGDMNSVIATINPSGEINAPAIDIVSKKIPLLSHTQAALWPHSLNTVELYVETSARVSARAFAVIASGESMVNASSSILIPSGATVVFDNNFDESDINGKIVAAVVDGTSEITIKKFVQDGPIKMLMSLNPMYPPVQINNNCKIVGIAKQVIINL